MGQSGPWDGQTPLQLEASPWQDWRSRIVAGYLSAAKASSTLGRPAIIMFLESELPPRFHQCQCLMALLSSCYLCLEFCHHYLNPNPFLVHKVDLETCHYLIIGPISRIWFTSPFPPSVLCSLLGLSVGPCCIHSHVCHVHFG